MDDKKMNIKKLAQTYHTGTLGGTYKFPYIRICNWKNIYRKAEKCLCSGTELLFMSRGSRSLSHWFLTGCGWKLEL